MDHTLGHGQGTITDLEREEPLALGVHRHPDPLGRPFQALDGVGRADFMVLDRAEQGKEFIELHLPDPHVVQNMAGKGPQQLGRLHQPLQHGVRVHLAHAGRAPDAQPLRQACDDAYDELDRHPLAMEEGAKGLEKIATTDHTEQLPPGTATGMAIGTEIAPAHPAPIGSVRVRAKVRRGVDLAAAPLRGHDAWGWS